MMWKCRDFAIDLSRVRTMGIVNVTPDSFSDGGLYNTPEGAFSRARTCAEEGAAVIDVGAESTRPGATPVPWETEWSRLEPVLARIVSLGLPVSIDTYHPETAARALEAGAAILNCVYPENAGAMLELAGGCGAGVIVPEEFFDALPGGNPAPERIVIDPMIGFGTTREEDLRRLGALRRTAAKAPVCVGVSRKRIVKKLAGGRVRGKNLGGTLGAAIWCAMNGASIVRVHDVAETVQAIRIAETFSSAAADGAGGAA